MKKALLFQKGDNVVVALENLEVGDQLLINGEESDVFVKAALPQGHKVAIRDIAEGENIVKYSHVIGSANCAIAKGDYVQVLSTFTVSVTCIPTAVEVGVSLTLNELDKLTHIIAVIDKPT